MARRTLVEGHRNSRCQIGLDLHALLRSHKNLVSVDVGTEGYTLLLDLAQTRKGEYLESTGICQDRLIPVHKLVESAELLDQLVAGPHMQVVGVGQLHLCADLAQVIGGNRTFDGGHRTYIQENRSLDRAVYGLYLSPLGTSVRCDQFISHNYFSAFFCFLVVRTYQRAPVTHTEE